MLKPNSPTILDIRRSNFDDSILDQVWQGLKSQPKTLPALLFYSTEGIQHWNQHSHASDFYPRKEETQILRDEATKMAASIKDGSIVVDLGSASLDKVLLLLEALEDARKSVTYYALDLSFEELESTLQAIPQSKFRYVRLGGLHGTFEDGLHWLDETPHVQNLPHCLLLFGLTIGNFSRSNAAEFLRNIAQKALARSPDQSSIIMALDSCKVPTKVLRAYTADGVVPFALASLKYGNHLAEKQYGLGQSAIFNPHEWQYLSEWNFVLGRHEASLIPTSREVTLQSPSNQVVVRRDEKVRFGCSYKYDEEEREELVSSAGLYESSVWSHKGFDVAFYQLKLASPSS
ncbi:EasF [Penicillium macrosclerotiorum]|uniref:EasF n=1 Tax=Penicillium macrosclerotiorum TaxID=303699 RepID=UPI0025497BDF|nr:EasF [Penicillium macrosclerotiorum]KAJ5675347.1 EasF [Penicillium macrosclerotiorum]